jgi:hypothetical protein
MTEYNAMTGTLRFGERKMKKYALALQFPEVHIDP